MKRLAIIIAAMACVAAGTGDHGIIERGLASGSGEIENDLYNGKAAVYRPIKTPIRIDGARGERCETRLSTSFGIVQIDWSGVRGLELGKVGRTHNIYLKGGIASDMLILRFPNAEAATPVLLAMERLQTACRPAKAQ